MAVTKRYRVLYDDWQMQCCGKPFTIGDRVEWLVRLPAEPKTSVDVGKIDYCYEAHDSKAELFRLNGYVVKITGLYEKFVPSYKLPSGIQMFEGVDGELRELGSVSPRSEFLHSAAGWGRRDDDYEISGYIIELENCSVSELRKDSKL